MDDREESAAKHAAALLARAQQPVVTEPVRLAIAHYFAVRSAATVTPRSAIDPAQIRGILPNVILIGALGGEQFQVRLAGTGFRGRLGHEITGTNWLDLFPPEARSAVARCLTMLLTHPCGAHLFVAEGWRSDPCLEYVLLPVASPGAAVADTLFGAAALIREFDLEGWPAKATARPTRYIDIGYGIPTDISSDGCSGDQRPGLFRHDAG